jgi:CheY-like chemotaxis protein
VKRASGPTRILLVEDSLFTRVTLTGELSEAGYVVDSAESLPRAFELVAQNSPEVAVIDIFLADDDSGLDLVRDLRRNAGTASTFIIVMSGHYAPDCLRAAREAGCDCFLVKPCSADVISDTIEQFLETRRKAAAV